MFLYAVALFACPFIIGLTVGVGGIEMEVGGLARGAEGVMGAGGGGLPPEMTTIAMAYVMIQAFICGLAVGVIRYGKMSKGLGYSIAFLIASAVVFSIAQMVIGGMAAA
jgi:hypothetical protein